MNLASRTTVTTRLVSTPSNQMRIRKELQGKPSVPSTGRDEIGAGNETIELVISNLGKGSGVRIQSSGTRNLREAAIQRTCRILQDKKRRRTGCIVSRRRSTRLPDIVRSNKVPRRSAMLFHLVEKFP
jgi:hypothetical protein